MNKIIRQQKILDILKIKNFVSTNYLKDYFNVTALTIRKDLKYLEENNFVKKVYGGIRIKNYLNQEELVYNKKFNLNLEKKKIISKAALEFINSGENIVLDTGTTNLRLASNLKNYNFGSEKLTVLTYDLKIAIELCSNSNIKILFLGGFIKNDQYSTFSFFPFKQADLNEIIINKIFLGVDGVDLNEGYTCIAIEDGLCKKTLLEISKEVIVLADSSKFNQVKYYKIGNLNIADLLISDSEIPENYVKYFSDENINFKIV